VPPPLSWALVAPVPVRVSRNRVAVIGVYVVSPAALASEVKYPKTSATSCVVPPLLL
jgi:hypothetical protein